MREKKVTFRHFRYIACLPNGKPKMMEKEMRKQAIEDQLKKGYVPMGLQFEEVKKFLDDELIAEEYYILKFYAGYAGKKQARIIYEANKETLEKPNFDTLHIPMP